MPIRAFLFDCGGVLLRDGDVRAYGIWAARFGLTADDLRQRLWHGETWAAAELGHITDAEFWERSGSALGLAGAEEVAAFREALWGTLQVDERVLSLVDRLRRTYRVAILSNATDDLEASLADRYHVADRFDAIVNSARLGLAKPDPAIYERALAVLGVPAAEAFFIDDQAKNVTAAAEVGLHVAWFVGPLELERQLKVYLREPSGDLLDAGDTNGHGQGAD